MSGLTHLSGSSASGLHVPHGTLAIHITLEGRKLITGMLRREKRRLVAYIAGLSLRHGLRRHIRTMSGTESLLLLLLLLGQTEGFNAQSILVEAGVILRREQRRSVAFYAVKGLLLSQEWRMRRGRHIRVLRRCSSVALEGRIP